MKEGTFIQISLEDSKTKSISEVLNSKICKKIINYLAENEEASQKDLSDALEIPMNTMDYNMKKLLESGFVQKRKNFFWSKKGKKIVMYELSNKSIVISPKKSIGEKFKSIVPGFMLTAVGTFAFWVYDRIRNVPTDLSNGGRVMMEKSSDMMLASAPAIMDEGVRQTTTVVTYAPSPTWMAFMAGGLIVLFVYSLINWRKL